MPSGHIGAYYNDSDPFCAAWLRNLISAGLIAPGEVDERSILDISVSDLQGFTQWHLFAGIAGWSAAFRLAEWPDDRPVLTASVPCQPFSAAGRRRGHADDRNPWPYALRLIRELRPPTILGEQVAAAVGYGWLDGIFHDLEGAGYAVAAVDLPACSVGAPHIRQRLFWVAESTESRLQGVAWIGSHSAWRPTGQSGENGDAGGLGDAERERDADDGRRPVDSAPSRVQGADEEREWLRPDARQPDHALPGFWDDAVWLPCLDGKARRVEPGIHPLAHGVPARMGRLRAYGNSIVVPLAAQFVRAAMSLILDNP